MNTTEWADLINASWQKSVASIVETGRLLIQAKQDLGHGKWCSMFRGKGESYQGKIPFTVRTAQMLLEIARHPILSNAKYASHLPLN